MCGKKGAPAALAWNSVRFLTTTPPVLIPLLASPTSSACIPTLRERAGRRAHQSESYNSTLERRLRDAEGRAADVERHAKDQEARALDCEARAKAGEVGPVGEAGRGIAALGAVLVVVVCH